MFNNTRGLAKEDFEIVASDLEDFILEHTNEGYPIENLKFLKDQLGTLTEERNSAVEEAEKQKTKKRKYKKKYETEIEALRKVIRLAANEIDPIETSLHDLGKSLRGKKGTFKRVRDTLMDAYLDLDHVSLILDPIEYN